MSSTSADTALGLGEGSRGYEGLTIEAFIARPGLPQAHPQPIQGRWQLENLHAGIFEIHPDARCVLARAGQDRAGHPGLPGVF